MVFTEIIPKTLGTENWRSLMGFTARTIHVLIYLLYPVVVMSQWLTRLISRKKDGEVAVSREEVAAMADMGEDEGVIDEDENKIIQNIITLEDIIETVFGLEIIDEYDAVSDMQQYARERWHLRQQKHKEINFPIYSPLSSDGEGR